MNPTEMSSEELVAALKEMARIEHSIDRDALLHLYELDRRGDIARAGFDGVAQYCLEELGFKDKAARCRAKAIGMMKTWPRCVELIADGSLTMSTLIALSDVLTAENHQTVLDDVGGMSEAEVELYLMKTFGAATRRIGFRADQSWQADYEELRNLVPHAAGTGIARVLQYAMRIAIGALRQRRVAASDTFAEAVVRLADDLGRTPDAVASAVAGAVDAAHRGADANAVGSTVAAHRSADARHQSGSTECRPGGDASGEGGNALPRPPSSPTARTTAVRRIRPAAAVRRILPLAAVRRTIPIAIRRVVWKRDAGCCTYVAPSGRRCGSTRHLEIHHRIPHARGGPPTLENLTLMCRVHNQLMAVDDFGLAYMEAKRRRRDR